MATVTHGDTKFTILDEIKKQHPKLVELVLGTESMDNTEKQYWFDILPSMTDDQVQKLYDILETERKKLAELEEKYEKEVSELNEKNIIESHEKRSKESKKRIAEQEGKESSKSKEEAEDALGDW